MNAIAEPIADIAALLHATPEESAELAHLHYVHDEGPGIGRKKAGKGFSFVGPDNKKLTDKVTLERIRKLAIPPAYTRVWICPDPDGHLQATGLNPGGKKQYMYHERWRMIRDEAKYGQMLAFGELLPGLRAQVAHDLTRSGLPREKVLAAVVQLLDLTHIRIGNDEYAEQNQSYGLTTLRKKHVKVDKTQIRFEFKGKSGKQWQVALKDRRLAKVIQQCESIAGQELFKYLDDDGVKHGISSTDVNQYLKALSGEDITAKYFRTWAGTVSAVEILSGYKPAESPKEAKKNVTEAIKQVSKRLGNTPSVCRKSYIHPEVLEAYVQEKLDAEIDAEDTAHFSKMEAATLVLLKRRFAEPMSA